MIKLFKKIRRKIWDWRMNRLIKKFAYFYQARIMMDQLEVNWFGKLLDSDFEDQNAYEQWGWYSGKYKQYSKLEEKYFYKINRLLAKINGQK